uniref:PNPLA domain-containing protein n=1 Tax=Gongylonema pulchrum TaxID=637853 RepID=A0A183EY09_9BILA
LVNLVSLDGGGVRGLILIQILLHIERLLGHSITKYIHWFAGTSTGAMIALALAKGDSLRDCQSLYLRMKDEIFVGRKPYSEKVIEEFLRIHFGKKTTMAQLGPKRVVVTATSVRTNPPKLRLFRNYTLPLGKSENIALGFEDPSKSLVWKCARYSRYGISFS